MFALRTAGSHLALSYVEQGVKEIPQSARIFFVISAFFYSFWWLLAPAIVCVLFTVAILTSQSRQRL
jgi:type II secretory pathway component PulF